jgi:hypothetical protein
MARSKGRKRHGVRTRSGGGYKESRFIDNAASVAKTKKTLAKVVPAVKKALSRELKSLLKSQSQPQKDLSKFGEASDCSLWASMMRTTPKLTDEQKKTKGRAKFFHAQALRTLCQKSRPKSEKAKWKDILFGMDQAFKTGLSERLNTRLARG